MDAGLWASKITSRLLGVDGVFRGVQRALRGSLGARRTFERNAERILAGLNLASLREVERVLTEVKSLDRDLVHLTSRIETLRDRIKNERIEKSQVG